MQRVVGIAAVGIDRDQGRIVGHQVLAPEGLQEPLLHLIFVGPAVAHPPADFLKGRCGDGVNRVARCEMRLDLLLRQGGFKLRHQVTGADYVLAQSTDQIDGARIHQ